MCGVASRCFKKLIEAGLSGWDGGMHDIFSGHSFNSQSAPRLLTCKNGGLEDVT